MPILKQSSNVNLVPHTMRKLLLSSTALVFATSVHAQNIATVNGGAVGVTNSSPSFIFVAPGSGNTVVDVNSQSLTGPAAENIRVVGFDGSTNVTLRSGYTLSGAGTGAYLTSTTGNITGLFNGAVTASVNGLVFDARFGPDGGNVSLTSTANITGTSGWGTWLLADTGTINLSNTATITGAGHGIYIEQADRIDPTGAITVSVNNVVGTAGSGIRILGWEGAINLTTTGTINAAAGYGVYATTTTGNITANLGGAVTASGDGVTLDARFGPAGGNVSLTSASNITGGGKGVWLLADTGTIDLTNTATITGATGVLVEQSNAFGPTGAVTLNVKNVTSTAGFGIRTVGFEGATTINATGAITSTGGTSIYATSTTGDITVNGSGTSTVFGTGDDGVVADARFAPNGGNVTIHNFSSIRATDTGVWGLVDTGTLNIQGNGAITGGGIGVLANSISGNINIGNTTANGVILGATDGINAQTVSGGNVHILASSNVTGTSGFGIYARTYGTGTSTIDVTGATTIQGGTTGIDAAALGSGAGVINIAAPATVQGNGWGVVSGSGSGIDTINNSGLIRTTNDTGAASTAGGIGIWNYTGTGVTNNNAGGRIVGSIVSGGTAYTLNNNAGGTWTPGLANTFATTNDLVSNSGLINVRSGNTVLAGLENLRNNAGGVINMQYGAGATDTLTTVGFSPQAGSALNVNVETGAPNGAGDSGGQGRGDTVIVTGVATPGAASTINIAALGATQTTLTGSIALVDTAAADVIAPAPGAKLTASTNYVLGTQNLPMFGGKYKYTLVDDAAGGVFLVWQPNITAETMGAFFGGKPGSASAAGAAAGKFAGLGGLGGSPSSGAVGGVGDAAANSAGQQGASPQAGGAGNRTAILGCAPTAQPWTVFMQGDLAQSSYKGGGSTNSSGGTFGAERDLSGLIGNGCSTTIAAGIFGTYGGSNTGSNSSTSQGLGAYLRASTSFGLYGAAVASFGRTETDMSNAIFGSTAKQNANNQAFVGTIGYVHRFNAGQTWLDARGSFGIARSNGKGFTDSVGIVVDGTKDELRAFTGTVGLHHAFTPATTGYIRAGVRHIETMNSATAFGITVSGKGRQTSGIAEIGLSSEIMKGVALSVGGFGEQSKETRTLGGNARLSIKF